MATKITQIPLNGLSTSPSDFICTDGSLCDAMNVFHEDGGITPVAQTSPELMSNMKANNVVYRHEHSDYVNLIVKSNGNYYWCSESSIATATFTNSNNFNELYGLNVENIASLGNTIVFYTKEDTYYYLYKNKKYNILGSSIPELKIELGLSAHAHRNMDDFIQAASRTIFFDDPDSYYKDCSSVKLSTGAMQGGCENYVSNEDESKFSDAVFSAVNRFCGDWANENGYFTQPFLVRVAYRLFDGSLSMHTAPIFMNTCIKTNPVPIIMQIRGDALRIDAAGVGFGLTYKFDLETYKKITTDWSDIIESVDIFVSSPFYTFNQAGTCKKYYTPYYYDGELYLPDIQPLNLMNSNICISKDGENIDSITNHLSIFGNREDYKYISTDVKVASQFITKNDSSEPSCTGTHMIVYENESTHTFYCAASMGRTEFSSYYGESKKFVERNWDSERLDVDCYPIYQPFGYVELPEKETTSRDVEECSSFYLVKSIDIDELSTDSFEEIEIESEYMKNLELNEAMSDDYDTHHKIIPGFVTTYNNRVNLSNIKKKYFDGFEFKYASQYLPNGDITLTSYILIEDGSNYIYTKVGTYITNGFTAFKYYYYPNMNAKKLIVLADRNSNYSPIHREYIIKLKNHDGLNGSFVYSGSFDDFIFSKATKRIVYNTSEEVNERILYYDSLVLNGHIQYFNNYIYTSETGNPFVFKASNCEQIGNGKIIALVPQAVALSDGQFGAYPMMCFTTDGIWALSVNNTGGWSAKQPFSRDVVLNEDAGNILQLDRQVMFASDRGLMLINGSNVDCISENFDGQKDSFSLVKATTTVDSDAFKYGSLLSLTDILDTRPEASEDNLFVNFKEFIGNAVFLYDYTHQRIIIGNESYPLAFVYNMKDKAWTTINQRIVSAVNSYPRCYAMTKKNVPLSYSKSQLSGTSQNPSVTLSSNKFIVNVYANSSYTCFAAINKRPNVATSSSDIVPPGTPIWLYSGNYLHLVYAYSNSGEYTIVSEETITAYKEENMLVDFSSTEGEAEDVCLPEDGFVMTRPIKLGDSTALKTIRTINAQGKFDRSHVDMVLLGCNDNAMKNWFVLSSCKGGRLPFKYGTPFKYFRVALLTHLEEGESINSLTIEYEVKETNKLRQ